MKCYFSADNKLMMIVIIIGTYTTLGTCEVFCCVVGMMMMTMVLILVVALHT